MSSITTPPEGQLKQSESDGSDLLFPEPNLLLFSTNSDSNMSKASSKASSNISSNNSTQSYEEKPAMVIVLYLSPVIAKCL